MLATIYRTDLNWTMSRGHGPAASAGVCLAERTREEDFLHHRHYLYYTGIPRGKIMGIQTSLKLGIFFSNCVQKFLLIKSKINAGKRYKCYTNFTFCFSFWGTLSSCPLPRSVPLDPTREFRSAPFAKFLAPPLWTAIVTSWVCLCFIRHKTHKNSNTRTASKKR